MACLDGSAVAFEDFLGKAAAEFTKAVGILLPCAPCGDGGAHYLVDGLVSATRFKNDEILVVFHAVPKVLEANRRDRCGAQSGGSWIIESQLQRENQRMGPREQGFCNIRNRIDAYLFGVAGVPARSGRAHVGGWTAGSRLRVAC